MVGRCPEQPVYLYQIQHVEQDTVKPDKMENQNTQKEYFKVSGEELLSKVKEIIKEGNATRVIIKDEDDKTVVEFPVTVGAIGILLAPVFAAVGAIAALATKFTIVVEKKAFDDRNTMGYIAQMR